MERPDQLRELFRMQKSLHERAGMKTGGMSQEEKAMGDCAARDEHNSRRI